MATAGTGLARRVETVRRTKNWGLAALDPRHASTELGARCTRPQARKHQESTTHYSRAGAYGFKPNMRTMTSMMGVDAVKVSSHVHMFRTKSVINIPVTDRTTTMASRLSTFQIE